MPRAGALLLEDKKDNVEVFRIFLCDIKKDINQTCRCSSGISFSRCLVPESLLDPAKATTYGTGQLISAALDAGAREIVLGIGGSATTDCGFGCLQALGVDFLVKTGEKCVQGIGGGLLNSVVTIDISGIDPRLMETRIRVAYDVENPLTGANGAARVFAPQKGATKECVERLETGLENAARLLRDQLGADLGGLRGAGAAGGLGAGLVAMAKAKLENGGKLVAEVVRLKDKLAGADLCITGEGSLDSQSLFGKATMRVANVAGQNNVSTICIAGVASVESANKLFREVRTLVSDSVSKEKAVSHAEQLLSERTKEAVADFIGR